jgi:hypothetical protein
MAFLFYSSRMEPNLITGACFASACTAPDRGGLDCKGRRRGFVYPAVWCSADVPRPRRFTRKRAQSEAGLPVMDAVRRQQGNDQLMAWPQYAAKTTPMRVRQRGLSRAGSASFPRPNLGWVRARPTTVGSLTMDFTHIINATHVDMAGHSYGPLVMEDTDEENWGIARYRPKAKGEIICNMN